MPTKLTITKKKETKFTGADGNVITYYWYKGLRGGDNVTVEFGSKNEYEEGEELEIILEKYETKKGFRYKEVA